jgi:hypothetical protein
MAAKDYEVAQLAARARHSCEGNGPPLKETAWVKAAIMSALLFVLGQYMCRTETALSCGDNPPRYFHLVIAQAPIPRWNYYPKGPAR